MKLLKVKTVRFAEVVEKAGRPETYTLWQKPAGDRHLQSQIKNNRVMTVERNLEWLASNRRKGQAILFFRNRLNGLRIDASSELIGT